MNPLPTDWVTTLRDQGVAEAEIVEARALALRHAEAAAEHPHDPLAPAGPVVPPQSEAG
jgi:hypothetical protein